MPQVRCACNKVIPLGEIPSPHKYTMLSDTKTDELWTMMKEQRADEIIQYWVEHEDIVVKCPDCGRLLLWDDEKKGYVSYKREEE